MWTKILWQNNIVFKWGYQQCECSYSCLWQTRVRGQLGAIAQHCDCGRDIEDTRKGVDYFGSFKFVLEASGEKL